MGSLGNITRDTYYQIKRINKEVDAIIYSKILSYFNLDCNQSVLPQKSENPLCVIDYSVISVLFRKSLSCLLYVDYPLRAIHGGLYISLL